MFVSFANSKKTHQDDRIYLRHMKPTNILCRRKCISCSEEFEVSRMGHNRLVCGKKACLNKRDKERNKEYYAEYHKRYKRDYYGDNRDRILEQKRALYKKHRQEVFVAYGGAKCSCCGETEFHFLCIDHVNGGGNKHRKEVPGGVGMISWLRKNNYPKGFRVLCHNCNQAIAVLGRCPHGN